MGQERSIRDYGSILKGHSVNEPSGPGGRMRLGQRLLETQMSGRRRSWVDAGVSRAAEDDPGCVWYVLGVVVVPWVLPSARNGVGRTQTENATARTVGSGSKPVVFSDVSRVMAARHFRCSNVATLTAWNSRDFSR